MVVIERCDGEMMMRWWGGKVGEVVAERWCHGGAVEGGDNQALMGMPQFSCRDGEVALRGGGIEVSMVVSGSWQLRSSFREVVAACMTVKHEFIS